MELRSLKFAVTLAEELHFGRAAERHFVSAQPFGRTIAALEREIGTPLFNRTTRRVELTPAGDKFVSRAEQVLVDVEELVRSVRSAADVESDHLVLGVFGVGLERPWPGIRTPAVIAAAVANTGRPSLHAMAGQTYYPHPRARYVPCEGSPLQLAVSIRADETRPAVHHFVQVTRAVADLTPR